MFFFARACVRRRVGIDVRKRIKIANINVWAKERKLLGQIYVSVFVCRVFPTSHRWNKFWRCTKQFPNSVGPTFHLIENGPAQRPSKYIYIYIIQISVGKHFQHSWEISFSLMANFVRNANSASNASSIISSYFYKFNFLSCSMN